MSLGKIIQISKLIGSPRLRILDVGAAYYGQAPIYQTLWQAGVADLVLIDADAERCEQLKQLYPSNAEIINVAVGPAGESDIYICPAGMTSLLKPRAEALAFFNHFTEFGKVSAVEKITLHPLDTLDLGDIDFLKIDVQGSEQSVIETGTKCLSSLLTLQLEVSFIALYEKQPTQGEIDIFLRGLGMTPHCMAEFKRWPIAPLVKNNNPVEPFNQMLEADFVYFKDPLKLADYSSDTLAKALLLAIGLYGSLDLAVHYATEMVARGYDTNLPQQIVDIFLAP